MEHQAAIQVDASSDVMWAASILISFRTVDQNAVCHDAPLPAPGSEPSSSEPHDSAPKAPSAVNTASPSQHKGKGKAPAKDKRAARRSGAAKPTAAAKKSTAVAKAKATAREEQQQKEKQGPQRPKKRTAASDKAKGKVAAPATATVASGAVALLLPTTPDFAAATAATATTTTTTITATTITTTTTATTTTTPTTTPTSAVATPGEFISPSASASRPSRQRSAPSRLHFDSLEPPTKKARTEGAAAGGKKPTAQKRCASKRAAKARTSPGSVPPSSPTAATSPSDGETSIKVDVRPPATLPVSRHWRDGNDEFVVGDNGDGDRYGSDDDDATIDELNPSEAEGNVLPSNQGADGKGARDARRLQAQREPLILDNFGAEGNDFWPLLRSTHDLFARTDS